MMPECRNCNSEWRKCYEEAVLRFDKALNKAIIVTLISIIIAFICIIATISIGIRTQRFIASFEYVEETEIEIEQNEGINTAILGDKNEVNINGTENKDQEKEVLATEIKSD